MGQYEWRDKKCGNTIYPYPVPLTSHNSNKITFDNRSLWERKKKNQNNEL